MAAAAISPKLQAFDRFLLDCRTDCTEHLARVRQYKPQNMETANSLYNCLLAIHYVWTKASRDFSSLDSAYTLLFNPQDSTHTRFIHAVQPLSEAMVIVDNARKELETKAAAAAERKHMHFSPEVSAGRAEQAPAAAAAAAAAAASPEEHKEPAQQSNKDPFSIRVLTPSQERLFQSFREVGTQRLHDLEQHPPTTTAEAEDLVLYFEFIEGQWIEKFQNAFSPGKTEPGLGHKWRTDPDFKTAAEPLTRARALAEQWERKPQNPSAAAAERKHVHFNPDISLIRIERAPGAAAAAAAKPLSTQ
jgi:hypothetical protein